MGGVGIFYCDREIMWCYVILGFEIVGIIFGVIFVIVSIIVGVFILGIMVILGVLVLLVLVCFLVVLFNGYEFCVELVS